MDSLSQPLSLSGRRWALAPVEETRVARLGSQLGLPSLVARCLALRASDEAAPQWLRPSLDHLHDPFAMLGMDAATERLRRAVVDRHKIRIVTDYDVDGTTSSLLLQSTLKLLGATDVDWHIPDRMDEGYGLSVHAATKAGDDGVDLLVTADIGVRDHEAVTAARSRGVDVIICDHHLPSGESVPADANVVLCPPQEGCTYPNPALAACGVSLKVAQAMLRDHPKRDALLMSMLKLAAIGTVADVVDLSALENRAIVALGLEQLNRGPHSPGLAALIEVSDIRGTIRASDLGFRLGPRINAAGRLTSAGKVVELFNERDPIAARRRANELNELNKDRQTLQRRLVDESLARLPDPPPDFCVLWGNEADGWHRGVVGIVAARVRDTVHRPAAVISMNGPVGRGSIRSTPEVHAVQALDSVSDLLVRYGGHPVAAGFEVEAENLHGLAQRLDAFAQERGVRHAPELLVDAVCALSEVDVHSVEQLLALDPHGKGNPAPRLQVRLPPCQPQILKDRHLKLRAGDIDALWWNSVEHIGLFDRPVDVVAAPEINTWRDRRTVQLMVEDVRPVA